jgi:L-lactate dehydrogenase complex protein LldG
MEAKAAMTTAQEDILARVKRAQYADQDADAVAEDLRDLGRAPPAPLDCEDVLESFLLRLAKNKVVVEAAANRSEAVQCISRFLYQEHNTHKVVAGNDRRLAAMPWREGGVLVRFDTAVPEDPVSVSYAKLAVAESGSLLLYSNRDNPGANNWLVKDHLVLLDGLDLVASFEDAWAWMRSDMADGSSPRGITFISGPSSTGDIVGHLVQGAHGPQRLHVIFIGEVPEGLLQRVQDRAATTKA